MARTADIFACSEGGMGVDAMGLRLASRPATELRFGGAAGRVGSDIVSNGGGGCEGKGGSNERRWRTGRKEILISQSRLQAL